jgi:hypothetical protein
MCVFQHLYTCFKVADQNQLDLAECFDDASVPTKKAEVPSAVEEKPLAAGQ